MQHFSMPIHELTEDGFEEGYGFDGSSIRGFQEIQESDMLLIPDPDTAVIDPFRQHPTINLNCFVQDPVTGESYSRDPRYVAKKAEEYLKGTGIADTPYFGPEAEFYIFDQVRFDQNQYSGYYFLDSVEGVWNSGREFELDGSPNLGYKPRYKEGYFPVPPMDSYQDLRSEMVKVLESVGVEIEVQHHEVGTAGQAEIDMRFDSMLRMADKLMLYKYVIKNVATARRQVGDLHAEADLHGQRLGHARAPVALEGRRAAVLRREGLRRPLRHRALVHRRPALARAGDHRVLEPDDELVQAARARATRRRSTSCTASGTAPRRCASRCTRRARRPSGSSSGAPTRRATRTSRSRRCSWPGSTASRTRSSRRRRSTATSTTCRPRSSPRCRRCRARSTRRSPRSRPTTTSCSPAACSRQDVIDTWVEYKRENEIDAMRLRPHPYEFYMYYDI